MNLSRYWHVKKRHDPEMVRGVFFSGNPADDY